MTADKSENSSAENERLAEAIARDIDELARVEKLTNEQLVDEVLDKLPFGDMDILIEALCTRLDPTWQARLDSRPMTPEEQEMVARLRDKAMARVKEIIGG